MPGRSGLASTANGGPQPREVEVGVPRLQRIEGPGDQVDALGGNAARLLHLQGVTDAPALMRGQHRGHVAMVQRPAIEPAP